jgi:ankyrin repeat protein
LHAAAFTSATKTGKDSHLKIIDFLLKQPSLNILLCAKDNSTALHFFARTNLDHKQQNYKVEHLNLMREMIAKGIDPNQQNSKGETCLHQVINRYFSYYHIRN